MNAVIGVLGVESDTPGVSVITDLVRRTIDCYVHVEATFHRHYTTCCKKVTVVAQSENM